MPELSLNALANVEEATAHERPASLQRHLEQGSSHPSYILRNVGQVGHERESLDFDARNVRLNETVDFAERVLDAAAHHRQHALVGDEIKLLQLLVSHLKLLELAALWHETDDLLVVHVLFELGVYHVNSVVLYVVVAGRAAQVCGTEQARGLVEPSHVGLVQLTCRDANQVLAVLLQVGIALESLVSQAVVERIEFHAHVQIGVAEPFGAFDHIGHWAQADLGVQVVGEAVYELRLDRRLACH